MGEIGGVKNERRAVAYVRMSTEKQNYSIQHQRIVIDDYALRHSISIVRTYSDSGKSGLRIEGRAGLKSLLADVASGYADFDTVLVYDVSRWGRFQDADESAYYEFICKRAGINVVYCAELFAGDDSPMGAIFKSLKRLMAGEYSRELSAKVFAAQSNYTLMGFKQGGTAGYGLRRVVVDHSGHLRRMLRSGERKMIQSDRVVLVPGPVEEIEVVHTIYDWYMRCGLGERRIAAMLNTAGIPSELGKPWTGKMVHSILTNEKYAGNSVFNRKSYKLKKKSVKNPPEMWIRKDGAFPAVVPRTIFSDAQAARRERHKRYTDEYLLEILRSIHQQHGKVSALLISQRSPAPTPQTFKYHFGTLANAYSLAGVASTEHFAYVESRRALRAIRASLVSEIVNLVGQAGGSAVLAEGRDRILVNGELIVKVMAVRCQHEGVHHQCRWRLRVGLTTGADFTIAAQMDGSNRWIQNYYLLPKIEEKAQWLSLPAAEEPNHLLCQYRYSRIEEIFALPSE